MANIEHLRWVWNLACGSPSIALINVLDQFQRRLPWDPRRGRTPRKVEGLHLDLVRLTGLKVLKDVGVGLVADDGHLIIPYFMICDSNENWSSKSNKNLVYSSNWPFWTSPCYRRPSGSRWSSLRWRPWHSRRRRQPSSSQRGGSRVQEVAPIWTSLLFLDFSHLMVVLQDCVCNWSIGITFTSYFINH